MHRKRPGFPKGKKHSEIPRSQFGERLYKTRKARGLSQTELGNIVGLSQRMISHYEGNPPEAPPVATLTRLAEALQVTVSYLLGESTLKSVKENINPSLQKHFKKIQELSSKDQKKVLEYIDLLFRKNSES